jgi:PAS domain S-box-containing protein
MTERKQIEEALKQCEEKFLRTFRQSPLSLSLTTAKDHRFIEVNETFERVSGWNRSEVIGRTTFDIELYVDPSQRIDVVKRLLSAGTVRNFQFLARLRDRTVRTIVADAALVEIEGETCVLGLGADVTDLKRAAEAKQAEADLSRMGRRLIQAQEEERREVARELHEYVERLSLLSIDMGRLQQDASDSVSEFSQQIGKARQEIEDLVIDIQTLSQRLHSSKLEYLGFAAAARNLCKEFSHQKKIEIDFVPENITKQIPQEVSLCLFRVLQEALQNAANYSESQRIRVLLGGGPNEIYLTVRDSGIGFDMENALETFELGLAIMKERLKIVGGDLAIESRRGSGTTIHARVPLNVKSIPQRQPDK